MKPLVLSGLDGQNPLGYFAALGLLYVLDQDARARREARPQLAFAIDRRSCAVVWTSLDLESVIGRVLEDAAVQGENPALQLAYDEDGRLVDPRSSGAVRDLKPTPAAARTFLDRCARSNRRAADLAAGFFSELVKDKTTKGNAKPTAFHFIAGNQLFLKMVDEIRQGIVTEDVREALLGPWTYRSTLPSLSWDSSVTRLYALRAKDPADPKEKRGSVPAAYWLAVQALAFYPVSADRGALSTPGVSRDGKYSTFTWALWSVPISAAVAPSVVKIDSRATSAVERAAMGITQVFSSRISRLNYYGSFSPADVVLPRASSRT